MELKEAIGKCLLENDGLCMDVASERARLAKAIEQCMCSVTVHVVVFLEKGWVQDPKVFSNKHDAMAFIRGYLKENFLTGEGEDVELQEDVIISVLTDYNEDGNGNEIRWFETELHEGGAK